MYKILVIEDNEDIRENLEEILELSGYQVVTAENGLVGIEKAMTETPHFILCDVAMPFKDGYEVFEELTPHIEKKEIPFVFLTASAQERDIAKGRMSGADAYITKPFQIDFLLKVIGDLLN